MITRTCHQCGADYDTYPSQKPKYCSSQCAGAAKRSGEDVACAHCGGTFYRRPSKPEQTYCSKSCARSALNLTEANPALHRDVSGENNPMHGRGLKGEANGMHGRRKALAPRWKGGRRERPDGYVRIVAPDDYPVPCDVSSSGTKYVLEHRYVMEQHLGRYLHPEEVVHHVDEDPSNNAISNLRLYASQAEHIRDAHG